MAGQIRDRGGIYLYSVDTGQSVANLLSELNTEIQENLSELIDLLPQSNSEKQAEKKKETKIDD